MLLDTHVHTRRHSQCSAIDEFQLIRRAMERGLDGLVLTEHHYQWSDAELAALKQACGAEAFLLLAGFEYSSERGDILIYGLAPEQVKLFPPGEDPEAMLRQAQRLGAVCVAAHPTRAYLDFDSRIERMPFDALEIRSTNLKPHEQESARKLADRLGIPPSAASDAHRLEDVGACVNEFDGLITSMADFTDAVRAGAFSPVTVNPAGHVGLGR